MRKNYREITFHTSPSQKLSLQEEGQACTLSEESCPGQLCGSTMWLCLHGDMGSGPILPLWSSSEDVGLSLGWPRLDMWCGPPWRKSRRQTAFRSILTPQGNTHRCKLLQSRQPSHYFLYQWIAKCPWDMDVTCQEKCKCSRWKSQVGYSKFRLLRRLQKTSGRTQRNCLYCSGQLHSRVIYSCRNKFRERLLGRPKEYKKLLQKGSLRKVSFSLAKWRLGGDWILHKRAKH